MNNTLEKQSTITISGCCRMPAVKDRINRANLQGYKTELEDCQGHGCNCKVELLRKRKEELQAEYKKPGTDKHGLWQEINSVQRELREYGTH
jgi:hypothetical protein